MQSIGRGLIGVFGFKAANIQGLLIARNAFDRARDINSQKAAKKLIQQELTSSGTVSASPKITAGVTVGGNEILNQAREPLNVPLAPPGAIR